jgi:phage-related protein
MVGEIPVSFYGPVREIIHCWPFQVRKELGALLTRLQRRESIGMPDIRPMPSIHPHASEIRIRWKDGSYRVLYIILTEFGMVIFHAFDKKSAKTPEKEKRTARIRLKSILKELGMNREKEHA